MSGKIPLSISGFNEKSAAIFTDFSNFFNFTSWDQFISSEPITKTVLP